MNAFESEIKGKKVLVFGLGKQGGGSGDAAWLTKHGATVRISDTDLTLASEGQTKEQVEWADIIIKNPGVRDDNELIHYAKSLGKSVLTSIAIFVKYAGIKTIAVTGTRGKSTTVALIAKILEKTYPGQIISGGNIPGTSGLSLFDQIVGKKYAVLELSSFQLHNFHDLSVSPNYALLTNIYPDHLNRYSDMASYLRDKQAIYLYQKPGDYYVEYPSAEAVSDWETPLPGIHNRQNIAGAWSLLSHLGISEITARSVVAQFKGLPFRQEIITTKGNVFYINDTTATSPTATIFALQAATSPTIWITGGDTKNLPFDKLLTEVKTNSHLKKIVILGSKNIPDYTSALAKIASDKILGTTTSMDEAVNLARQSAVPGDTILLSPGFASFDLFQNEFDRGRQFNTIVHSL